MGALRFRGQVALLAMLLLAGGVALSGMRPAQQPAPTAQTKPPEVILRRPDSVYTEPIHSFAKNEPFVIEVKGAKGSSIDVTVTADDGTARTLTIQETGPGSGSYISQPVTVEGGAQRAGNGRYAPAGLSRQMDGIKTTDGQQITVGFGGQSNTFTVYDTNVTQAVGEYKNAFAVTRKHLVDTKVAAQILLRNPHLTAFGKAKLLDTVRIVDGKLKLIDDMQTPLDNPPQRQGFGDHTGTMYWRLNLYTTYWYLVRLADPSKITVNDWSTARNFGKQAEDKSFGAAYNGILSGFVIGGYAGVMNASMIGPFYTATTGKNIFGNDATPEEIEGAITALVQFAVTLVVVPPIVDSAVGTAANDLSGLGNRPSTPAAPVAGAVDAGLGDQTRTLKAGFDGKAFNAQLESGIADVRARGASAIQAGVPFDKVSAFVDESIAEANTMAGNGDPDGAMSKIADADQSLATDIFKLQHPDATVISDQNQIQLIRSVRIKARLEGRGQPQTWTPDEVRTLHELNADPNIGKAFEFEDSFDPNAPDVNPNVEPGYQPVLSGDDGANISAAARKKLNVAADAARAAGKPRPRMKASNPPAANAANPAAATNPRQPAPEPPPPTPASTEAPVAGNLQPTFEIARLKFEIIQRRSRAYQQSVRGTSSPINHNKLATGGGPGAGMQAETAVVKTVEGLTPQEISRLTPDDITHMLPEARDKLPLNQLSARQLQAVSDEGIVLTDDIIKGLTPETIRRLPPEIRDLLPLDELKTDQVKAVADSMGLRPVLPAPWLDKTVTVPAVPDAPKPEPDKKPTTSALDALGSALKDSFDSPALAGSVLPPPVSWSVSLDGGNTFQPAPVGTDPTPFLNVVGSSLCCAPGYQPMMIDYLSQTLTPHSSGRFLVRVRETAAGLLGLLSPAGASPLDAINRAEHVNASSSRTGIALAGDDPPKLTAVIRSLGTSTGEAFEVEMLNDSTLPSELDLDGLVVEPLAKDAPRKAQRDLQKVRDRGAEKAAVSGYCLALHELPPEPGMLYRIAAPEMQQKFAPMRKILRAARILQQAQSLHPDSDPERYYESIKQWAIWTKEQHFTLQSFEQALLEHTKRNVAAAGKPWTSAIEQGVRRIVPTRWADIMTLLDKAGVSPQ
jgi:hypothetical protein